MGSDRLTQGMKMKIAELDKKLDIEKKKFLASQASIDTLRMRIAKIKCPYKIGDKIKVMESGVIYEIKVKSIDIAIRYEEVWDPKPGSETSWTVEGDKKPKKTKENPYTFPVTTTGFAILKDGVHINKRLSLKEQLDRMAITAETKIYQHQY